MAVSKRIATRFYQLQTGHALTGTHLKRIKATNDDRCWWCNDGSRQTTTHLIKECHAWRRQRESLKKEFRESVWRHRGVEHIFEDRTKTEHILKFQESTEIGNRTPEKECYDKEEERDDNWGWKEDGEEKNDDESDCEDEDRNVREEDTEIEDADVIIGRLVRDKKDAESNEEEGEEDEFG